MDDTMLMSMVDSYVRRKAWESTMLASKLGQAMYGSGKGGKSKNVSQRQMLNMMGAGL